MSQSEIIADIRNLTSKSVVYGLGSVFLRAIGFLLLPLYTRFLTPSDYGILAITGIVIAILGIVMPLSLHSALNPIYFFTSDTNQRQIGLGTVWVMVVVAALGITILIDRAGSYLVPLIFTNVPFVPYIRLAIWIAFLSTFSLVPLSLFQMQERARSYVALTVLCSLLQVGLVIYYVVFNKEGALGNLKGAFIGALTMVTPLVWISLRNIRPALERSVIKRALLYSLPLVPHSLAVWVLQLSDRAILQRFVSLEQLGLYSIGYTYGSVVAFVSYAINSAWTPFLFKTDAQEGDLARERLARLGTYFTAFLCWVALVFGVFSKEIIGLMTAPPFHPAAGVAPWIVAGLLLSGLYYFPINFLFLKQKTSLVPVVTAIAGCLSVVTNIALVPEYGIMASAWATFISYGVMLVLAWRLGLRVYRLPYEYMRLAKIALTTCALWLIGCLVPFPNLLLSITGKSILILSFPFILFALGFFTLTEKQRVVIMASLVKRRAKDLLLRFFVKR